MHFVRYGNHFIAPEYGELASGSSVTVDFAEPEAIIRFSVLISQKTRWLYLKEYWSQRGPQSSQIDPVRFISNRSSGKNGLCDSWCIRCRRRPGNAS